MPPLRPASMAKSFAANSKHRCRHQSSPSQRPGGFPFPKRATQVEQAAERRRIRLRPLAGLSVARRAVWRQRRRGGPGDKKDKVNRSGWRPTWILLLLKSTSTTPTSPGTPGSSPSCAHPCRSPPVAMLDPLGQVLSSAAGRRLADGESCGGGRRAVGRVWRFLLPTLYAYGLRRVRICICIRTEEVKLLENLLFLIITKNYLKFVGAAEVDAGTGRSRAVAREGAALLTWS